MMVMAAIMPIKKKASSLKLRSEICPSNRRKRDRASPTAPLSPAHTITMAFCIVMLYPVYFSTG